MGPDSREERGFEHDDSKVGGGSGAIQVRQRTWGVRVGTKISIAHFLPEFHGAEGRVHGHDWEIFANFEGRFLDSMGMVARPRDLLRLLNAAIADFQNVLLNDVPDAPLPPTPEKIAAHILMRIESYTAESGARFFVRSVEVVDGSAVVTFS